MASINSVNGKPFSLHQFLFHLPQTLQEHLIRKSSFPTLKAPCGQ